MKESMSQRVERKYPGKKRVIDAASGRRDADLVLKNASFINVFSNEICE